MEVVVTDIPLHFMIIKKKTHVLQIRLSIYIPCIWIVNDENRLVNFNLIIKIDILCHVYIEQLLFYKLNTFEAV